MNLRKAIELIQSNLPVAVQETVSRALESNETTMELTVPGFSVWYMKAPENVRFICDRRLVGCETAAKAKWLREQLDFLESSFTAATTLELWQSYCVTDVGRISFIIDTGRGKFCSGPFP